MFELHIGLFSIDLMQINWEMNCNLIYVKKFEKLIDFEMNDMKIA